MVRFSPPLHAWGADHYNPGIPFGRLLSCEAIADCSFDSPPETFHCYASVIEHGVQQRDPQLPCHTVTLVPPLVIANLLPCDVWFEISDTNIRDHIVSGQSQALTVVNLKVIYLPVICLCMLTNWKKISHWYTQQNLSMSIKLEKFEMSSTCLIHSSSSRTTPDTYFLLHDANDRF